EVIERRPVIICGIVMIVAGSEQVGDEQTVDALIMVQRFQREIEASQNSCQRQNTAAHPVPAAKLISLRRRLDCRRFGAAGNLAFATGFLKSLLHALRDYEL